MAGLVGKSVKLFFDDMGRVLCKEGVLISEDVSYTQIKTEYGVQAIPTCRVVRMEVKG